MSSEFAVLLLSGGIDSAACGHLLRQKLIETISVFVDYGQEAAACESMAAERISNHLGVPLRKISLSPNQHFREGEVVARNAFFLFTALMCLKGQSGLYCMGIHAGSPYYDCSPRFVEMTNTLFSEISDGRAKLFCPFLEWSKADVFDYFVTTGIPIEYTYSCERGSIPVCGHCSSCLDRRSLGC